MKGRSTVCFNIKTSWHGIARMYNEQAVKHGITVSVAYVLLSIDEQNGTPATQIGPLVGMESGSLTRMLNSLEKEHLIVRKHDDKDKRLVKILLTDKGIQKRAIAKKVVKHFNGKVREAISEEKLAVFFEVIENINSMISEKQVFNNEISNTF